MQYSQDHNNYGVINEDEIQEERSFTTSPLFMIYLSFN